MRFIDTRTHGVLDYLVGILLIAAPFLFGFANGGAAMWVPIVIGVLVIGASLMTDYELGVVPVIPMPMHLTLDLVVGVALAVSPWAFGFADVVWLPHVAVGLLAIGTSLTTQLVPDRSRIAGRAAAMGRGRA